jgi:hypothetical protein
LFTWALRRAVVFQAKKAAEMVPMKRATPATSRSSLVRIERNCRAIRRRDRGFGGPGMT